MPAMTWFLGIIESSYDQALSLDFEIENASPQQKLVLHTGHITDHVCAGVSMVMLEIPLRGMVMFMPNGPLAAGVDIQFGNLGWTYLAGSGQDPPRLDIFINEIGTPLFYTGGTSTITPDPGQGVTMWGIDASPSLATWSMWNAIDGDLTSNWSSIAYTSAQPAPDNLPWIESKFSLAMPVTPGRVVLYPRWGNSAANVIQPLCFPSEFTVSGHDSAGHSWDIYKSGSSFTVPSVMQVGLCWRDTNGAAYHRVRATGKQLNSDGSTNPTNYYFQLAEMELYTNVIPVPTGGATAQSILAPGNWGAENLIDGTFQYPWSSPYLDGTFPESAIALNLGQPTSFDRIVLYPRWDKPAGAPTGNDRVLGFPIDFTISASADNQNWNPLLTVDNFDMPLNLNAGIAIPLGDQFYQYIQIIVTSSGTDGHGAIVQLLQIEVLQS